MPQDKIVIRGAREHNLKNIDVTIPRDQLAQARVAWLLILFLLRDSAVMLNHCRLMRGNF
jgi:hypothetical protein